MKVSSGAGGTGSRSFKPTDYKKGTQINYSDMIQQQRSVRPESKPTGLLNAAVLQQNRWQMDSKQVLYSLIPPLPLTTKNQGREKLLSQGIPR